MKDKGLQKGLVQDFETSKYQGKSFFGFRKMFWDYLKKLHVPFYDSCCEDAGIENRLPVTYNVSEGRFEYLNPSTGEWTDITALQTTTTTTTTAAPSTTTTTTI